MSGGSYDYAYRHVEEMADILSSKDKDPLRRAFAKHLRKVAKAMHDIEWVDSGDYGKGDETKAVQDVLGDGMNATLEVLLDDARQLVIELQKYDPHLLQGKA